MQAGIDLLDELVTTLLATPPAARTTYAEAFRRTLSIDPHTATVADLATAAIAAGVSVPSGMQADDRDEWLNLLLATRSRASAWPRSAGDPLPLPSVASLVG